MLLAINCINVSHTHNFGKRVSVQPLVEVTVKSHDSMHITGPVLVLNLPRTWNCVHCPRAELKA